VAKKKHYPSPDRSVSYELSQILQNQKVRSRKTPQTPKEQKKQKEKVLKWKNRQQKFE
jgi:hypothetical protein